MSIYIISQEEEKTWLDSLGEPLPLTDEDYAVSEEKYLTAYDILFEEISRVTTIDEDGVSGNGGDVSMSSWMTPQRLICVVADNEAGLKPALLSAIRHAMNQFTDKFAVEVEKYPTQVYLFPGNEILIRRESRESDLVALGLR